MNRDVAIKVLPAVFLHDADVAVFSAKRGCWLPLNLPHATIHAWSSLGS